MQHRERFFREGLDEKIHIQFFFSSLPLGTKDENMALENFARGKIDLLIRAGVCMYSISRRAISPTRNGAVFVIFVLSDRRNDIPPSLGICTCIHVAWKKNKVRERAANTHHYIAATTTPHSTHRNQLSRQPESILSILHALAKCLEIRRGNIYGRT